MAPQRGSTSEAEDEAYQLEIQPSHRRSTDHLTPAPGAGKSQQRTVYDNWLWEITAMAVSLVGFALLVGFLVKVNNSSYTSWQNTASPNTVISIIITVTKSALLVPVSACLSQLKWNQYWRSPAPLYNMQAVDQASRGPLGSITILWSATRGLKIDRWTLTGAFITVLALGIDPFTQQILSFPSRSAVSTLETAFIQRANSYVSDPTRDSDTIEVSALDPNLISAVVSGVAQTSSPLEPICTSGDCTFGEFVSLGICSSCDDMTVQAAQTCHVPTDDPYADSPFNVTPLSCTYSFPSGLNLSIPWAAAAQNGTFSNESAVFDMMYWGVMPQNITFSSALGVRDPIVALLSANITTQELYYVVANATASPPKPVLTECIIYYCEKEYYPSVYMSQEDHSTIISKTQPLVQANFSSTSSSPVRFGPPNGMETTLAKNVVYTVDDRTYLGLRKMLRTVFNANTSTTDQMSDITTMVYSNGLNTSVQSVATSLTNVIRSGTDSGMIQGTVFQAETYIHVRWPWIILPLSAILATLVFLVGTMYASKYQQFTVLWKGSVIPLLVSRIETAHGADLDSVQSLGEMHMVAKGMRTRLDRDKGLVFVE
ncbi:hypothetical protein N7493_010450 [Penicillium malachiteum]|uniref:Uncharacterized protein n=1 Tax=Penicillium malachiteum TaxID=1324776 RepID=A0AAD6MRN8_9EURO|nr:hypothetical protein N7493_010450 [Penicillium malachiteum]